MSTITITNLQWTGAANLGSWGWQWVETTETGSRTLCTNHRGEGLWNVDRDYKQIKGTGDYRLSVPSSPEEIALMKHRIRETIRYRTTIESLPRKPKA